MLFKRNEIWYYKFTINGKTIYRSTGTADKAKAQEIADKTKAKTWDQLKGHQCSHIPAYPGTNRAMSARIRSNKDVPVIIAF